MSDEIDRSVEPPLGADAKKTEELPPGVRVRARNKKDTDTNKNVTSSVKKKAKSEKPREEKESSSIVAKTEKKETSDLTAKIADVEVKINSLSENLINTVRAMEESGSKLHEQESKFTESINDFQVYKESQQKGSIVVVISSVLAMLVAVMFLVFAISNFSSNLVFLYCSKVPLLKMVSLVSLTKDFHPKKYNMATHRLHY